MLIFLILEHFMQTFHRKVLKSFTEWRVIIFMAMTLTLWLQWLLISANLENRKEAGMLYDSALR